MYIGLATVAQQPNQAEPLGDATMIDYRVLTKYNSVPRIEGPRQVWVSAPIMNDDFRSSWYIIFAPFLTWEPAILPC